MSQPDEDLDHEPSSLDGAVQSVAAPSVRRTARARVAAALGGLLTISGPALFMVSLYWGDRSMDFPTDGQIRVGLFRNGLPVHWVCHDGHDHYSAPFWLASLLLSCTGLLVWWHSKPRTPGAGATVGDRV